MHRICSAESIEKLHEFFDKTYVERYVESPQWHFGYNLRNWVKQSICIWQIVRPIEFSSVSMWPSCGLPLNLNAIKIFYKDMHAASDDDDFDDDPEHDDSDDDNGETQSNPWPLLEMGGA